MTEKRSIDVRLLQVNTTALRMTVTYSLDGQPITSKSKTLRVPDGRLIDFDLTLDMTKLVQESLWFWANQMTIPGL